MLLVYLASLTSGVLYGITEVINKSITEKKYSAFSYGFLQWGLNALFYLIPFIIYGAIPKTFSAYVFFLGMFLATIIANITIIKAYKTEDVSNVNILSRISLVIGFLTGVILLQEKVNIYKILGVIFITFGVIVIFYEGKKFKLSPGYLFTILSGVMYGTISYFQKLALGYFNIVSLVFIFNLSASLSLLILPSTRRDIKPIFIKYKKQLFSSRICIVIGVFLLLWSLSKGKVSIINTNAETAFLLSTTLFGIIFLREKTNISKKLTGSLLCTLGIILLNFF